MSTKRKLQALVIGIDKYRYVRRLYGCKKDIRKVIAYLEDNYSTDFDLSIQSLFDDEATRGGIIDAFQSHLMNQIGSGDVALIYFSGHGAQEVAYPAFKPYESDGLLEGLVCYDSGFKHDTNESQQPLLADKELRYLLRQLSDKGGDVVMIADCCNSGDNTRSIQNELTPIGEFERRSISVKATRDTDDPEEIRARLTGVQPVPARKSWKDFIFADEVDESTLKAKGIDVAFPEGRYVQIAACEDREFAYEDDRGGVFTNNLLAYLAESQNNASYYELQSKVKFTIAHTAGAMAQTPRIYTRYGDEADVFKRFLHGDMQGNPVAANVFYAKDQHKWIMDRGAIHGVKVSDQQDEETLVIIPLGKGSNKSAKAKVIEVSPTSSILSFSEFEFDKGINKESTYQGLVNGLLSADVRFAVTGIEAGVEQFVSTWDKNKDNIKFENFKQVDATDDPNYLVQAVKAEENDKNYFIITYPDETYPDYNHPLVKQELGFTAESADNVLKHLLVFPKWHFLLNLSNQGRDALDTKAVHLQIFQDGKEVKGPANTFTVIPTKEGGEDAYKTKLLINMTNTTNKVLYVACLYMGSSAKKQEGVSVPMSYHIGKQLVDENGVARMEPGSTRQLLDHPNFKEGIPFSLASYIIAHEWKTDTLRLKVIASTEPFEVLDYTQEGTAMPLPEWPEPRGSRNARMLGVIDTDETPTVDLPMWQATMYRIQLNNPEY